MAATDREIITQARQSYYNLKIAGLSEFRCNVQPDWESILTAAQADEATQDEILPVMEEMHFEVSVGPDGASTVSRKFDMAPPNDEIAQRARSIADGIEQIVTGFYQTWSRFLINSPFPDPGGEFKLRDLDGKYQLFYKEGPSNISLTMGHDFTIDEMKVSSDKFEETIHPLFGHVGNALVLKGYQTVLNMASGTSVQVNVVIENGEYERIILPKTVVATVPTPESSIEFTLTFSNYKLKKR